MLECQESLSVRTRVIGREVFGEISRRSKVVIYVCVAFECESQKQSTKEMIATGSRLSYVIALLLLSYYCYIRLALLAPGWKSCGAWLAGIPGSDRDKMTGPILA